MRFEALEVVKPLQQWLNTLHVHNVPGLQRPNTSVLELAFRLIENTIISKHFYLFIGQ